MLTWRKEQVSEKLASAVHLWWVALVAGVVETGETVASNRCVGLLAHVYKLAESALVKLADKCGHSDFLVLLFF